MTSKQIFGPISGYFWAKVNSIEWPPRLQLGRDGHDARLAGGQAHAAHDLSLPGADLEPAGDRIRFGHVVVMGGVVVGVKVAIQGG